MTRHPHLAHAALPQRLEQLVAADLPGPAQPLAEAIDSFRDDKGDPGTQIRGEQVPAEEVDEGRRGAGEAGGPRQDDRKHSGGSGGQGGEQHLAGRVRCQQRKDDDPNALPGNARIFIHKLTGPLGEDAPHRRHRDAEGADDFKDESDVQEQRRAKVREPREREHGEGESDRGDGHDRLYRTLRAEQALLHRHGSFLADEEEVGAEIGEEEGRRIDQRRPAQPLRRFLK